MESNSGFLCGLLDFVASITEDRSCEDVLASLRFFLCALSMLCLGVHPLTLASFALESTMPSFVSISLGEISLPEKIDTYYHT